VSGRPAVFLDRDGVLNEIVERAGRPESPRALHEFRVMDGASAAVARLRDAGLLLFVVTNQPDVARGLLTRPDLDGMLALLRREVGFDAAAVCPHDDAAGCECRKPRPGLLLGLAQEWGVDVSRSYMVGDTWRDVDAGAAAGCRTVLLRTWYNQDVGADIVATGLDCAVDHILREQAAP
jgi:D-glycero-D-manno-heptose 1,7-bisphosphate phosphatase